MTIKLREYHYLSIQDLKESIDFLDYLRKHNLVCEFFHDIYCDDMFSIKDTKGNIIIEGKVYSEIRAYLLAKYGE